MTARSPWGLRVVVPGVLVLLGSAASGETPQPASIPVVTAAIPPYPDVAVEARISPLKLLVHLEVDSAGVPKAARMTPEFKIFKEPVEAAGMSWRFAPDAAIASRSITLTFLFRLVDESAPADERCSVFRAPYEVEIRRVLPKPKTISVSSLSERAPGR